MVIRYIFKVFIIFVFLLMNFKVFSSKNSTKILDDTILLYEKNENNLNTEQIEKNLFDLKESIQLDLKIGNAETPINTYLFLNGIIKDDIYSLQSLLSQNEKKELPNEISKHINFSIAKKLALGLKENRTALKTKIIIERMQNKEDCLLYINGTQYKNVNLFYTPSGIPIYLGLYCKDESFEIQKIHPSESQEVLEVYFNQFQIKPKIPISLPNPYKAKENNYDIQPLKKEEKKQDKILKVDSSNSSSNENNFQIRTGVGYLKSFGNLSNDKLNNLNLPQNSFLYSSTSFQYKFIILNFDYANVNKMETVEIVYNIPYSQNNIKNEEKFKDTGYFIRSGLGVHLQIFKFTENLELETSLLSNFVYLKGKYQESNKYGVGIQSFIGPVYKIDYGFLFDLKLGLGYIFGKLNGLQIDSKISFGYSF